MEVVQLSGSQDGKRDFSRIPREVPDAVLAWHQLPTIRAHYR